MKYIKKIVKERKFKYILFFWIIISAQFIVGNDLQIREYSIGGIQDLLITILEIILLSILFIIIHYLILLLHEKIKQTTNIKKKEKLQKKFISNWIKYFIIIIACWTPVLIAFYPIILNYDGPYQMSYFLARKVDTRQPIIHTLLIMAFYGLGYKINSCNTGMFLLSITQMTIMATIFSYTVKFIEEETNKNWLKNITLIFYALFPFNQLFPIMTTKDSLFAVFVLLFIINLYKIFKEDKIEKLKYVEMIIITTLMLLFRNNAIYAMVVSIPFIIFVLIKDRKKLKTILIMFIIAIIFYVILYKFFMIITNAKKDIAQEKLSIFTQAAGRVCVEKENELTDEEKEKISYYFKHYKALQLVYTPVISDNTKALLDCEKFDENKIDFIKFMGALCIKYPRVCIDSFLDTMRGYWYIGDDSFNKINNKSYPNDKGCLELGFEHSFEGDELYQYDIIPKLKQFYKTMFCQNRYTEIPVLYVIFQPAIYFYIVVAYLLYAMYKRNRRNLVIAIYIFLYFATCFLGPVAIIRYIYGIIVSLPVLLTTILKPE